MNKSAPSFGRIAAMVVFALSCFGLLLFLWLAFGGAVPLKPEGYRVKVSFAEATQLATEADVRISGVPVGKVKEVEPDNQTGRTVATIELEPRYAPLPSDARAILRQKTLLGETYVELTPGSASAPQVKEDGTLAPAQVSDTVQLDEILRAFDKPTRDAFQTWMQEQAQGIGAYGRDVNDALGNLAPFAEDTARIVDVLNRQDGAVRSLVSNTGVVFDALSERDGQLRSLIEQSNRVFQATASRNEQLKQTFIALPTFERESELTLDRLAEFAETTDPLITQLRPAARELSPTLQDLGALSPDLKRFFQALGPLIDASRTGFPAAEQILQDAEPLIAQLDPAMRQITPILQFLGLYKKELTSFFANTVAATQAFETKAGKKIHYLRTSNPLNAENLAVYPRRIGTNRPNAYVKPNNFAQLANGMPVFDNRSCGAGVPTVTNVPAPPLPPIVGDLVPDALLNNIITFAFNGTNGGGAAPPCRLQGPFTFNGETTQYPHVRER
jgi:virulence factor Mce-like protein